MNKALTILTTILSLAVSNLLYAADSDLIEPDFKLIRTIKDQGVEPFFVDWMVDVTARHIKEYNGYGLKYELAIPYYEKTNKKEPLFEPYPKEFKAFDDYVYKVCRAADMQYARLQQHPTELAFQKDPNKKSTSNIWGCINENDRIPHVFVLEAKRYQKLTLRMYSEADLLASRKEQGLHMERLNPRQKEILAKFQDTLKISYQTNWGQVLEIKRPMALIRYKSRTLWVRIEQLAPLGLLR